MAYKANDEKADLETGLNRSRSPLSSHVPIAGHDAWRAGTKETLSGPRVPQDRFSTIYIPAWNGSPNQPVQPKEPQFRKFGDPAPLALFTGALTLFILGLLNLNTRGVSEVSVVVGMAYGYSGFVQVFAGMWEFARGSKNPMNFSPCWNHSAHVITCESTDTFTATVFSSLGGFWISFALLETRSMGLEAAYTTKAELNNAVGFFLIAWFVFGVLCTLCTLKTNLATFLIFFLLDITFLILSIAQFHQTPEGEPSPDLVRLGGAFALATAFSCWYSGMVGLMDESNSFFTLPVSTSN